MHTNKINLLIIRTTWMTQTSRDLKYQNIAISFGNNQENLYESDGI